MSDPFDPTPGVPRSDEPMPPMVIPVRRVARGEADRPRDSRDRNTGGRRGFGRLFLVLMLLGSLGVNFLLCLLFMAFRLPGSEPADGPPIKERHYAGSVTATDKVAVIRVEGVLIDELMGYVHKQIDRAAKDDSVKAVVVRINSPGGTITASDDIYKRLSELRDGNSPRYMSPPKPLVASMGAMAASGGYYVAMPCKPILAEKTTITGSIGVYASFLNVHELAKEHGVKMELVKAGEVKAAGSPFHELKPEERQMWQDMVNLSYTQFLDIVEKGRPQLKGKLTKWLLGTDSAGNKLPRDIPVRDDKGEPIPGKTVSYKRKLADGGIFVGPDAKHFDLIDDIGYLEDATRKAATLAGLTDYEVVMYDKPITLLSLLGGAIKQPSASDFAKMASATGPRIWYLAPNSEFAGMLAIMNKE